MRRRVLLAATLTAVLLAVAGCSSNAPSTGPSTGPTAIVSATPTTPPIGTIGPPPAETPDDAAPVTIDQTLLDILPEKVGTVAVKEDTDAAAAAVNDPALNQIATGVDSAVAVNAGTGDLVLVNIVRLKPGAFGAELYRQWRDSYDEGACAGSGGVVGHAEAVIADRQTYVTSCVASMHTYHVWIEDDDILISASSIGEGRFGEELLKGLRLPS
ncbi:MAG TPA: hypothetical protein VJ850_00125 [Candidatus Limnocylindrales bacterium]|nr:hypothetical protein [Candidatus Limnocylindrales bacterium]